jgi:hypothetical protein
MSPDNRNLEIRLFSFAQKVIVLDRRGLERSGMERMGLDGKGLEWTGEEGALRADGWRRVAR